MCRGGRRRRSLRTVIAVRENDSRLYLEKESICDNIVNAACHPFTYSTHLCPPDRCAKKCPRPSATTVIWSFQPEVCVDRRKLIDWTLAAVCAPRPSAPLPPIPITPVSAKKLKHIAGGVSGTTTHFDDTTELAHKYLIIGTGSVTNYQY